MIKINVLKKSQKIFYIYPQNKNIVFVIFLEAR